MDTVGGQSSVKRTKIRKNTRSLRHISDNLLQLRELLESLDNRVFSKVRKSSNEFPLSVSVFNVASSVLRRVFKLPMP